MDQLKIILIQVQQLKGNVLSMVDQSSHFGSEHNLELSSFWHVLYNPVIAWPRPSSQPSTPMD